MMATAVSTMTGTKSSAVFPVCLAQPGEEVRITTLRSGARLKARLMGMGINVQDVLKVIQRDEQGAVIILHNGCRYALGGGMAQKIFVMREEQKCR